MNKILLPLICIFTLVSCEFIFLPKSQYENDKLVLDGVKYTIASEYSVERSSLTKKIGYMDIFSPIYALGNDQNDWIAIDVYGWMDRYLNIYIKDNLNNPGLKDLIISRVTIQKLYGESIYVDSYEEGTINNIINIILTGEESSIPSKTASQYQVTFFSKYVEGLLYQLNYFEGMDGEYYLSYPRQNKSYKINKLF